MAARGARCRAVILSGLPHRQARYRGLIFSVEFRRAERCPNADARPLADADIPDGLAVLRDLPVLVVDDNQDSADTLNALLRSKGHDVRTARDGLEAVDI